MIMTKEEFYDCVDYALWFVDRITAYKEKQLESLDYWKGCLFGSARLLNHYLYSRDWSDAINYNLTEEEKEQYSYDEDWTATSMDVSVNELYRQSNPNLEVIEEGKTYHSHIKPCGLLDFNGKIYPVYNDDAGQSEYIRINGNNYSAGAYNMDPAADFISTIINYLFEEKIKEIESRF